MFLYFMESVVIATAAVVMSLHLISPSAGGILLGCLFLLLIAITANSTHSIVGAAAPMDIGGKKMAGFAAGVIDSFQYYGAAIGLFVTGRMLSVSDGNYTYWFGIMTCFAFFGGCAMLSLLLRQKGRTAASRGIIAFMVLLVVAAIGLGVPKYRTQKAAHAARVAAEEAAAVAEEAANPTAATVTSSMSTAARRAPAPSASCGCRDAKFSAMPSPAWRRWPRRRWPQTASPSPTSTG